MSCHLAGFATLPFEFHRAPDAQRDHREERVAEIALHLDQRNPIGVQGIADRRGYLFWVLDKTPKKGMRSHRIEFRAGLRVRVYPVTITAV
jgi:hypothetical protein